MTARLVWGPRPDLPPDLPPGGGVPAVIYGPPALLSRSTTTLVINILVDQPVQAWLEYGTTASLGGETTHETSYLVSHTQVVSGLSAGTTYHVRAHVVNQAGLHTVSAVLLFQTLAASGAALQALVDGTSPGGTLDVSGMSFTAGATIAKAMTLVGGGTASLSVGPGTFGIRIAASGVAVRGMVVSGAGNTVAFSDAARGIAALGTASSRLGGVEVSDCSISSFHGHGVYAHYLSGAQILRNTIADVVYSGVLALSDLGGTIADNVIRRIGDRGVYPSAAAIYNAYGIATSDLGADRSDGTVVRGNVISDVPTWQGLDTHGGTNHQWLDNHVSRCNRHIFITSSYTAAGPQVVSGNRCDQPTPRPDVATTYPYNMRGLTVASGSVTGTGNTFDGFPVGSVVSGNATLTNTTIVNGF